MLLTQSLNDITVGQAGVYALLGYAVIFFGLILLMIVVVIMGHLFMSAEKRKTKKAAEAVPAEIPVPASTPAAPGSAGALKLHNVEPKTAALLMAIVADKLGKPLNELRFISIKEVTE